MSFQNKNFWIPTEAAGCLTNENMEYNTSSRAEPKRPHQWIMDPSEPELSHNKKQAIDAANSRLVSGFPNMNYPILGNQPNFQSVPPQYAAHLFNSENFRNSNLVDMNIPMVGTGDLNMGRESFGNPYGSHSSVGLSMSRAIEDPSLCLNYGGIRKAKVNQVVDPRNTVHVSSGQSYIPGNSNGTGYRNAGNGITLGPVFNGGESSGLTMGAGDEAAFNKMDGNFISMGHSFNKGDGNFMLMGQPFQKGNGGFISMGNPNNPSIGPPYNKENENFVSVGPSGNVNGNFISMGPSYDNIISSDSSDKTGKSVVSTVSDCDKGSSSVPSMGSSISFGGVQDQSETRHSADVVNCYSLPETQNPEVGAQENATELVTVPERNPVPARAPKTNATPKNKEPKAAKKLPVNNFPTHVKSLLSTGILDGVPVKYVAWSREKSVIGMIKGSTYLCGCDDCDFNKALNAYEFEKHAGCKTKHPNNHIYFENGKTIYAVVQELKLTPPDQLFVAIENATGSAIHQENFRIWKESFQVASRELQRIYGKDAAANPSSS